MIDAAEQKGYAHIVSWCDNGTAFKIHEPTKMVPIIKQYFRQTKYVSFLNQLYEYSFTRILHGIDKRKASHVHFKRGHRSMCPNMKRKLTYKQQQAVIEVGKTGTLIKPTNPQEFVEVGKTGTMIKPTNPQEFISYNENVTSGVENISNSCYLGSALQMIVSIKDLSSYLINNETLIHQNDLDGNRNLISTELKVMIDQMFIESSPFDANTPVDPRSFKNILQADFPQYEGSRQHDAAEVLQKILNTLSAENDNDESTVVVQL